MSDIIAAALQEAARLDIIYTDPALTAETEEKLCTAGDVLGGLSVHGFIRDLRGALDRIEEDEMCEAGPEDYIRGSGGNYLQNSISSWLGRRILTLQTELARDFLAAAREIGAPAAVKEAA